MQRFGRKEGHVFLGSEIFGAAGMMRRGEKEIGSIALIFLWPQDRGITWGSWEGDFAEDLGWDHIGDRKLFLPLEWTKCLKDTSLCAWLPGKLL